MTDTEGVVIW